MHLLRPIITMSTGKHQDQNFEQLQLFADPQVSEEGPTLQPGALSQPNTRPSLRLVASARGCQGGEPSGMTARSSDLPSIEARLISRTKFF